MLSKDQGSTWMMTGFPSNYYVTDVLELSATALLVSAQSHLFDREDGGIWLSKDGGATFTRVSKQATFTMNVVQKTVIATHARLPKAAVSASTDGGSTWMDFGSEQLDWGAGSTPFYTCSAIMSDGATVVVGGMTVQTANASSTDSALFMRSLTDANGGWTRIANQPQSMDEDKMPKDRMAILGDPKDKSLLYIAGNAGSVAWRINIATAEWTKMWDGDTSDKSSPHGDCRNYAYDTANDRLVLVDDGGIRAREQPTKPGGVSIFGALLRLLLCCLIFGFLAPPSSVGCR
jgi:hypothetical protein